MFGDDGVLRNASLVIGNFENGMYRTLVSDVGGASAVDVICPSLILNYFIMIY